MAENKWVTGDILPLEVEVWAPTHNWFLGPACSTVGSTIDQIQKHNCEKGSRTTLFLLPEAVCKKTPFFGCPQEIVR